MKKILSTLVVAGAMLSFAAVSYGQAAGPKTGTGKGPVGAGRPGQGGPGGPGGGMRQRMMKMQEEIFAKLNLNAKQKEQLKALQKKNQAKMEAMRAEFQKAGPNGDRNAMRTKMQAFRKEQQDALKKILTAEQFKKFETLMEAERKKMRSQFGGGRPGGPPGAPTGPGPRAGGPGAGGVKPGKGGA